MLDGYSQIIFAGAITSLLLAVASLFVSMLLGLMGALGKLSKNRLLVLLCQGYTSLVRGVPDLVLMLLIFYGLQLLLNQITDSLGMGFIEINPMIAGIITLGFIYGAYFTETFRGAYQSVSKETLEAATALGFRKPQVFKYILFPLMMRFALPGIANNWMVLLKATALVSLLGLSDLVRATKDAGEATFEPLFFALVAGIVYLLFTTLSNVVIWLLEKHYSRGIAKA